MNKRRKMIAISAAMAFLTMAIAISVIAPADDTVDAAPTEISIAPGMKYTYKPTYPAGLTVTTVIQSQGIGSATDGNWGSMSSGTLIVNVPSSATPGSTYNVVLKATSENPHQEVLIEIALKISSNMSVSGSQSNIVTGSAINMTPTVSGMGTFTWSVTSGKTLPAGLTLDPATGKVTGTPTTMGINTIHITATSSYGESKDLVVTFTVVPTLIVTNSPTSGAIIYV